MISRLIEILKTSHCISGDYSKKVQTFLAHRLNHCSTMECFNDEATSPESICATNLLSIQKLRELKIMIPDLHNRFVLAKGLATALRFNNGMFVKETGDYDLLHNPSIPYQETLSLLYSLGVKARYHGIRAYCLRYLYSLELDYPPFTIDFHIAFRRHPALKLDYHEVWDHRVKVSGLPIATLSDYDQLKFLSLGLIFDLINGKFDHKKPLDVLFYSKLVAEEPACDWIKLALAISNAIVECDESSAWPLQRLVSFKDQFRLRGLLFRNLPGGAMISWSWWISVLPIYSIMHTERLFSSRFRTSSSL